jgi:hypothetical protein
MPTLTRQQKIDKAMDKARALSTGALIISLLKLDADIEAERPRATETKDYDQIQALNMTRSWVIQVLEERYPAASDAVGDAFDAAEALGEDIDYVATLIAAIPESEK